ncbi:hypothetical protein DFJ74DRAFT_697138 [Hyaloraphidium curvatum]|nr:hypothetical protein DFJ74DRAFT_697138 [Hyaloraphidium curvatum]
MKPRGRTLLALAAALSAAAGAVADIPPDLGRALQSSVVADRAIYYLFGKRGDYNSGPAFQRWFGDVLAISLEDAKAGVNAVPLVPATGVRPRSGASCAFDAAGARVLCAQGELNDTSMDPAPLFAMETAAGRTGRWTEAGTGGLPRDSSSGGALLPSNGTLVTFAGRYQARNKTRDVLDAELRATAVGQPFGQVVLQNTTVAAAGAGPGPRIFHCVVQLDQDRILIGFGSDPQGKPLDDIWTYSFGQAKWTNIDGQASGTKPPAMSGPACSLDAKRNRVLVFGPGTAERNQVSALDLGTLVWSILDVPVPTPALLEPSLRWGASGDVVGDWMVVFGGYLVRADLYTYDARPYFLALSPTPTWQYAPVSLVSPLPTPTPPPSSGLSPGAIAGIAVAAAAAAATLIAAVVFGIQRHKLKKKVEAGEVDPEELEREARGWK